MEQTTSSDLEVFFTASPSSTSKGKQPASSEEEERVEERSINPVTGWEEAWKRSEEGLVGVKERAAVDSRKGNVNRECRGCDKVLSREKRSYNAGIYATR